MNEYEQLLKKKRFSLFCIRFFDFTASSLGLLVISPMLIIVSLLIALTDKGGVFFKQARVGKGGKEFTILKFRTMVVDAESKGLQLSTAGDSRITKVGRFLRKTKIDELPQLFNVVKGDMSLVGPRPEVPKYVALYTEEQCNVLLIRPGITEMASIVYKDENDILDSAEDTEKTYIEVVMPKKLALNLDYIKKIGLFYNIGIIVKTIFAIL